jgi:uncharacterized protein involved in cysteine biosynthesis
MNLEQLLPAILILGLVTAVLTKIIRKGVEKLDPSLHDNKYWRDIILPLIPIVLALWISYFAKTDYLVAVVAGGFSATTYRIVKSFLNSKITKGTNE